MDQFDPNVPGSIEGSVTSVAVTDPQPFLGGRGNHVVDPTKAFTLTVEWEVFGQLVPVFLAALAGNWRVSVYGESFGSGPDLLLGEAQVATTATQPCTVNQAQVNCTKYAATVTVPAGTLQEHVPGSAQSGIYKLMVSVFLDSTISGAPGYDLIGFIEGPFIQAEPPA